VKAPTPSGTFDSGVNELGEGWEEARYRRRDASIFVI
jgi:hypothetical protein